MQLARIDGHMVAAHAHETVRAMKLLICQPITEEGEDVGLPVLAIDTHGAGLHDRVMMTTDGSSTRKVMGDDRCPVRNMVLGIIDEPCE